MSWPHRPDRLTWGLCLLLLGCSAKEAPAPIVGGEGEGELPPVCAPGATQLCFCPDGTQRAQTCQPDGRSWGVCLGCPAEGEGEGEGEGVEGEGEGEGAEGEGEGTEGEGEGEGAEGEGEGADGEGEGAEGEGEGAEGEGEGAEGEGEGLDSCLPGLTEPCPDGDGPGECRLRHRTCNPQGRWGECVGAEPTPERCDGLDNDCDGQLDEELFQPCPFQEDACYDSRATCVDGRWQGCGEVLCLNQRGECQGLTLECDVLYLRDPCLPFEVEEECDGLDEDCDGQTDQGLGSRPCASQEDACAGAQATCQDGQWQGCGERLCINQAGDCAGLRLSCDQDDVRDPCAPLFPDEVCDGRDNDCDGELDEELEPPPAALQQGVCQGLRQFCDARLGWQEPDLTGVAGYEPEERSCDQQDNDCDGERDEGLGLGQACWAGLGACRREGVLICDGQGGVGCTAQPGEGSPERCNGIDDDCDDRTDEAEQVQDCPAGQVCHQAACCTPTTCAELGHECGDRDDGCGGRIECGSCPGGFGCNADGHCQWAGDVVCGGEPCPRHPKHWSVLCNTQDHCEYAPVGEAELPYQEEIWVPAGSFLMGAPEGEVGRTPMEGPVHEVTFARGFFVGKYEVTVARYQGCEDAGRCTAPSVADGDEQNWGLNRMANDRTAHPQNGLSWSQARGFCQNIGSRLPSEAEWEYVATGRQHRLYPWGDAPAPDCQRAIMNNGLGGCGQGGTAPVGSVPLGASACGVLDLAGNLWEWLEDAEQVNFEFAPDDGTAWIPACATCSNSQRSLRGGSYFSTGDQFRTARREWATATQHVARLGARCVRDLPHCQDPATDCPGHPLGWPPACNAKGFCEYQPAGGTLTEEHQAEIYVPPGSFPMGSPDDEADRHRDQGPVHQVTIARGFFIGKYEVTTKRYEACEQSRPEKCSPPSNNDGSAVSRSPPGAAHPQDGLSRDRAGGFCQAIGARLPTEAEWEVAASGYQHRRFPWGDFPLPSCAHADFGDCQPDSSWIVGSAPAGASAIGALDMAGNLQEWVQDCYHNSYVGAPTDGSAWLVGCTPSPGGHDGTIRGGDLNYGSNMLQSSFRWYFYTDRGASYIGARCARDLPGPAEDQDADGVANEADNCPAARNPGQADQDADQLGDACDPDADGDGALGAEGFQDEVIDRLFVLNAERVRDEQLAGATSKQPKTGSRARATSKPKPAAARDQLTLLDEER